MAAAEYEREPGHGEMDRRERRSAGLAAGAGASQTHDMRPTDTASGACHCTDGCSSSEHGPRSPAPCRCPAGLIALAPCAAHAATRHTAACNWAAAPTRARAACHAHLAQQLGRYSDSLPRLAHPAYRVCNRPLPRRSGTSNPRRAAESFSFFCWLKLLILLWHCSSTAAVQERLFLCDIGLFWFGCSSLSAERLI